MKAIMVRIEESLDEWLIEEAAREGLSTNKRFGRSSFIRILLKREMLKKKEEKKQPQEITDSKLKEMMQDPKYWREQDPKFVKKIEAGFKKLYGGGKS